MSKLYSIFDQAHLGTSLQLSNSDQVVTTTANSLNLSRLARCLYGMSSFSGNVEWLVYGTGTVSTSNVAVGVCDGSAGTSTALGADTHSYAFKSDGDLYNNGSSVASSGVTWTNGDVIGMAWNAADSSLKFWKNGVLVLTYSLPQVGSPAANDTWYPAASLGSTTAGDLSIFFNAGQQAFQYPLPGADGWWDSDVEINPIRLASEDFTSPTTDTVPSAVWDGAIASGSLAIVRSVEFWVWRLNGGSFSGGQSYGAITIDDPEEKYSDLLNLDVRDQPAQMARTQAQESGASADGAQAVMTGVVDRVSTAGDFQKVVYIKDKLAILDQPVQKALFLPNVDAAAAGRPLPIVAGACRSVPGILIAARTYVFADQPLTQLAGVRVAGKLMTAGVDYLLTSDQRGIVFDVTLYPDGPQGKVTADCSTVGGSTVGLTDILQTGGALGGQFDSYTVSTDLTDNWTLGGYFSNVPAWAGSGTDPNYPYPRLEMGPQGGSGTGTYIESPTNICRAGYSYTAKISIEHIPAQALHTSMPAYLFVGLTPSYSVSDGLASVSNPYYVDFGVDSFGSPTKYLTFANLTGVDKPFVMGFQANNVSGTHGVGLAKIASVELYEQPLSTSVVNLSGMTLEQYCRFIIETKGGLDAGVWNSADAAAIDADTGYVSIGHYISEPTTIRNALQPVLDSYCADLFIDRSGVIRIVRLVDPGTITSSGTLNDDLILGPVASVNVAGVSLSAPDGMIAMSPDPAFGLTTRMGARPNRSKYTQGDFGSTSLTDCPNSVRALLTQDFQAIAASGAQLSRSYKHAQQAQPMFSCFDDPTEAQTEIDRVNAMFTSQRFAFAIPAKSDETDTYELGQAWQLVYPKYNLSAGKPVLIPGISENPQNEQLTNAGWG